MTIIMSIVRNGGNVQPLQHCSVHVQITVYAEIQRIKIDEVGRMSHNISYSLVFLNNTLHERRKTFAAFGHTITSTANYICIT